MGGNTVEQPPLPAAPDPLKTARASTQAQLESLPAMLQAQQQFGPGFAQAYLDLQKKYGTQFGEELRKQQEATNPELVGARKTLTDYLAQEELLTPTEQAQFQQDVRASQGVRGFGLVSGVGAQDEFEKLTELRQNLKARKLNIALSTAGRAPVTGASQVDNQQFVQNVNPSQIFGLASSNYSQGSQNWGVGQQLQQQANASQQAFWGDIIGGGLGMAGSLASGGMSLAGTKALASAIK